MGKINKYDTCKYNNHCSFQGQTPEGMIVAKCLMYELKETK